MVAAKRTSRPLSRCYASKNDGLAKKYPLAYRETNSSGRAFILPLLKSIMMFFQHSLALSKKPTLKKSVSLNP